MSSDLLRVSHSTYKKYVHVMCCGRNRNIILVMLVNTCTCKAMSFHVRVLCV